MDNTEKYCCYTIEVNVNVCDDTISHTMDSIVRDIQRSIRKHQIKYEDVVLRMKMNLADNCCDGKDHYASG